MKLRVLIVDDDPAVRQAFGAAVAATQDMQAVGLAADLAEGARLLRSTRPDVLLVDLGLPDGNGITLIREAARTLPDCDVMVVSVFGDKCPKAGRSRPPPVGIKESGKATFP